MKILQRLSIQEWQLFKRNENSIFEGILYKLESKPPPESKPLLESKPSLQCISNGQVYHREPLFESKPRAYYPDYTVIRKGLYCDSVATCFHWVMDTTIPLLVFKIPMQVYFADARLDYIEFVNYDGSGRHTVVADDHVRHISLRIIIILVGID